MEPVGHVVPKDYVTSEDLDVCIKVLVNHFAKIDRDFPKHPLCGCWSIARVCEALYTARKNDTLVLFVDKTSGERIGFLLYQIGVPWWGNSRMLSELGIYTIKPGAAGFGRIAVEYLIRKAQEYACCAVEAGGAVTADPQLLYNTYRKYGFDFNHPTFLARLE